jgi:hypothetical protein
MVGQCVNSWCPTPPTLRHNQDGKLFRLDINLGNKAGGDERKTEYIWLCAHCALEVHPTVVVTGNTISVRLAKNPVRVTAANASFQRAN